MSSVNAKLPDEQAKHENALVKSQFEILKHDKSFCKCEAKTTDDRCGFSLKNFHLSDARKHLKAVHKKFYSENYNMIVSNKYIAQFSLVDFLKSGDKSKTNLVRTFSSSVTYKQVEHNLIKLFTVHGRPINMIEDQSFIFFLQPFFDAVNLVVNRKKIKQLIHNRALEEKNELKEIIKNQLLCLKFDRKFLSVNLQFSKKGVIILKYMKTIKLDFKSTQFNLHAEILRVLREYEISLSQVISITVDNGRNMVGSCNLLRSLQNDKNVTSNEENMIEYSENDDFQSSDESNFLNMNDENACMQSLVNLREESQVELLILRCFAHTMQLGIIKFADEKLNIIISDIKKANKTLRSSEFIHLIKELEVAPKNDNETRWFSKFLLLESFLRNKDFIRKYETSDYNLFVTETRWKQIREAYEALRIPFSLHKKMQSVDFKLSDFMLHYDHLMTQLKLLKNNQFADNLQAQISVRCDPLLKTQIYLVCSFLDPRLKNKFQDKDQVYFRFINSFFEKYKNFLISEVENTDQNEKLHESTSILSSETTLEEFFAQNYTQQDKNLEKKTLLEEYTRYIETPISNLNTDPMQYWHVNSAIYPILSKISMALLSIPGTQVSVERVFSSLSYICNKQRSRIGELLLDDILFLRINEN